MRTKRVARFAATALAAGLCLASAALEAQRPTPPTPARSPSGPPPNGPVLDPRSLTSDLPFAMPVVALPRIPARVVRITDHGARGDGATLNTGAIAAAIEACGKAAGGRVVVPRGVFLTGPIELKSRIDLHLERGAVLLFSPQFERYPMVRVSYEGGNAVRATSPVWAKAAEDIAITGEGVVDGSGQAWRPVKKAKMTAAQWQALLASGGMVDKAGSTWWPTQAAMAGADTLNVTVLNPWFSQNGDGLDLDSCRRVIVCNCRFDVGDDAVRNSRNIAVEGGAAAAGTGVFLRVDGANSGGIRLGGVDTRNAKTPVEIGDGVRADAVVVKGSTPPACARG